MSKSVARGLWIAAGALFLAQCFPSTTTALLGFAAVGGLVGLFARGAGGGPWAAAGFALAAASGPIGGILLAGWDGGPRVFGLPLSTLWIVASTVVGFLVTAGLFTHWERNR